MALTQEYLNAVMDKLFPRSASGKVELGTNATTVVIDSAYAPLTLASGSLAGSLNNSVLTNTATKYYFDTNPSYDGAAGPHTISHLLFKAPVGGTNNTTEVIVFSGEISNGPLEVATSNQVKIYAYDSSAANKGIRIALTLPQ